MALSQCKARLAKFALVDCAKSDALQTRFNFTQYPVYLMYYATNKLVFAGTRFARFGSDKDSLKEHIFNTLDDAERGMRLAEDFRFL